VEKELKAVESLEVHASEGGKIIITLCANSENGLFEKYKMIKAVKGTLSTELAFCGFAGEGPNREMVNGEMPDWLNSDIDAGNIKYGGRLPRI